ncbi:hypothetical protein [Alteromonas australica]|uniref:Uncharacterized protein n=1 Tax=Alteromonas australica TaxID=589873 RepID=A0A358DYH4_9ALTE|nr:hypothetical protein [Alteromonas australica]HBU51334.1 hypothetical protein [Alteromonas australica]
MAWEHHAASSVYCENAHVTLIRAKVACGQHPAFALITNTRLCTLTTERKQQHHHPIAIGESGGHLSKTRAWGAPHTRPPKQKQAR